jgi:glycosyltransferase involved in cell wall biosynthesis
MNTNANANADADATAASTVVLEGDSRKRVLIVCDGMLRGGLAKVVLAWIAGFTEHGHTVGLALLNPRSDYPTPPLAWGDVYPEAAPRNGLQRWQRRAKLTTFIRASIVSFEAQFGAAHLVLAAGEDALRCAAQVDHHNLWISSHSSQLQSPKAEGSWGQLRYRIKIWRRGQRLRALLDGRNIHFISEGQAREMTDTLGVRPARMKVIANPFDIAAIRAQALETTPQSSAQKRPYIIGIGEFNARKAFDRLIDAFAKCKFDGDLVLVGQGEAQATLAQQAAALHIAERVKFVPFHDNHYALLARAKLLVMTSKSEGLPNTLVESLIVGVPAVALDCPHGPKEIIGPVCADALLGQHQLSALPERIDRFATRPYEISDAAVMRFHRDHVLAQLENLGAPPISNAAAQEEES